MQGSKRDTAKFLIDTNLFVAAIYKVPKKTKSLELLLEIIRNENIKLVGNEFLLYELLKYADRFRSSTAALILNELLKKIKSVEVKRDNIEKCEPYFPKEEIQDAVHAATCLQTDAILITNNYRHFGRIQKAGLIKVWSINKAIQKLLSQ